MVNIEKAMPGNSNEERLEEILATCMAEFFAETGITAQRVLTQQEPPCLRESLAGFCGFGSTDLRGSITVLGSTELFSHVHPLPATVTPSALVDWACEFVNQTVGRYRNRLLAYNVNLALGVPQSALAENVRLSSSLRRSHGPIRFAIEGVPLEVWLELSIRPGFKLADNPADVRAGALREGSILFF
jgi:hypothetical protein